MMLHSLLHTAVIPAKAGIQCDAAVSPADERSHWVPTFAGMTPVGAEASVQPGGIAA